MPSRAPTNGSSMIARTGRQSRVLGQNISSEFYAGRFREEDGLVTEWIEIEAESG